MKHYKVVRSYDDGMGCEDTLQAEFDDGYEFVRASEYVPEITHGGYSRYGYIEYILVKEERDDQRKMTDNELLLAHANALKQHCQARDRSGVLCEGCPFVFYRGTDECCALNNDLCPADWYWEDQK